MLPVRSPGLYREEPPPAPPAALETGVCALIGGSSVGPLYAPTALRRPEAFRASFGISAPGGFLAEAVAGFFANGGARCVVVRADLAQPDWLLRALAALRPYDQLDLVCAPDLALSGSQQTPLQRTLLQDCEAIGGRFAILDAPAADDLGAVLAARAALDSRAGALYYPWIGAADGRALPPCGHIAGIYARTDRETGFFAAPANAPIVGAVQLLPPLAPGTLSVLADNAVNPLRPQPGRGIWVWGARTLAGPRNQGWEQVSVCRLFLTVGRWLEHALTDLTFETNNTATWIRVRRLLSSYLWDLWRRGALRGDQPEQAFFVKCDSETNPAEVRSAGLLVAEIGLAPVIPAEFIIVRLVRREGVLTANT